MLGNTTEFLAGEIYVFDSGQKGSLTVVDMTHHGNNWRPSLQT